MKKTRLVKSIAFIFVSMVGMVPLTSHAQFSFNYSINSGPSEIIITPLEAQYELIAPQRTDYNWVQGYWAWNGYTNVWVAPHWEQRRQDFVYFSPSWPQREAWHEHEERRYEHRREEERSNYYRHDNNEPRSRNSGRATLVR